MGNRSTAQKVETQYEKAHGRVGQLATFTSISLL